MGAVLSQGASYQTQITQLVGSPTSVIATSPVTISYAALFTSYRVLQVRVRYQPAAGSSISDGFGTGLAAFFNSAALTTISPLSNLQAFRTASSNYKPFYVGRAYRATWTPPRRDFLLNVTHDTGGGSPGATGGLNLGLMSWGYAFSGNNTAGSTYLGALDFEFLVEFFRA